MQPATAAPSKVFTPAVLWFMAVVDSLIGLALTGLAVNWLIVEANLTGTWPRMDLHTLIPLLVGLSLLGSAGSLHTRRPSVIFGSFIAHILSSLLLLALSALFLLMASLPYVGEAWMIIVPPLAFALTLVQLGILAKMRRVAAAQAKGSAVPKNLDEELAVKPGWDEAPKP